jgi:hypothetical protein
LRHGAHANSDPSAAERRLTHRILPNPNGASGLARRADVPEPQQIHHQQRLRWSCPSVASGVAGSRWLWRGRIIVGIFFVALTGGLAVGAR